MMKKVVVIVLSLAFICYTLSMVLADSTNGRLENTQDELKLGVEVLLDEQKELIEGKRVGLITNPTGVDQALNSIVDRLHNDPAVNLTALYGPEHGVRGDAQAGEYVEYYIDEQTGLPVYSLYGETRKPTPEMLENVDVLLFDIQDVGARFYTYIYTMAYAMEAAQENGKEFIVLDRPNPLGGYDVGGPVLDPDYASFVGNYPIPLRHGLTVGELANLFNEEFAIGADLKVVEMNGWERGMYYNDTNLEFVMPSPNMPTFDTALVYPGAALIEGTNVSEGRGTTKPFELIGAPFINSTEFAQALNELEVPGVLFRAASFTPMFSKHSGTLTHGVQIHVIDKEAYQPVITGLHILKAIHDMYPDEFAFRAENSSGISFFDNLIGNGWVREAIENGDAVEEMVITWNQELERFKQTRRNYLLYKILVDNMQAAVDRFTESGAIEEAAKRKLTMHLTAVAQYEEKGQADKVRKHMKGFKLLLDQQKDSQRIVEEAYSYLMKQANDMIKQWQ